MNVKKQRDNINSMKRRYMNPSICPCEYDQKCKIDKYLNNCIHMKVVPDTLVIPCEKYSIFLSLDLMANYNCFFCI